MAEEIMWIDSTLGMHGHIRDVLKRAQFKGMKFDFVETGGFFCRRFDIRGDSEAISAIRRYVQRLNMPYPEAGP